MASRTEIDRFLSEKRLALAGASRTGKKFGNAVIKDLKPKGFEIFPVHPEASEIEGTPCYRSIADLPAGVENLILSVPPEQTERLVQEAAAFGIKRVWMQQGAQSANAIRLCEEKGIRVVHGECILMFAEPLGWFHGVHRWIWKVMGRYPR
jgi:uncharacterized protein